MTDPILYDRDDDGIVTLTLNLPEKRNPISDESVVDGLEAALARLDDDRQARVAILTGAGKAFSSGGDLKAMKDGSGLRDPRRCAPVTITSAGSSGSPSPSPPARCRSSPR